MKDLLGEATKKLRPCPFCGSKAGGVVWMDFTIDQHGWPTATIVCGECNSIFNTCALTKQDAVNRAIEKWNRRYNG